MKPEEMTIEQLKAAVYDRMVVIEKCQSEMRILNDWINKKSEEAKPSSDSLKLAS